jgi:hypothetical protein
MFILVLNLVPYTQTSTKIDTSQVIVNTLQSVALSREGSFYPMIRAHYTRGKLNQKNIVLIMWVSDHFKCIKSCNE